MSGFASMVLCAGCGERTPYAVGEDASFGEWLRTPLGWCYRRTHRVRSCVEASRAEVRGRPFVPGPTREERQREELAA